MTPWICVNGRQAIARESFGIMAICNLTPDSFYDGGSYAGPNEAAAQCTRLTGQGADILDLGAESTRPGSVPIEPEIEAARLLPVLESVRRELPDALISVDTRNSGTARLALAAGCDIVNDISACSHDRGLLEVIAEFGPGYVLTHGGHGADSSLDIVSEVGKFFEIQLERLVSVGLPEDHVVLDPGIGFGKTFEQNLALLRHISAFLHFRRPLLCGISMKSLFGELLGLPVNRRGPATAVLSALLYSRGVTWHRVHEPLEVAAALRLAQALNV